MPRLSTIIIAVGLIAIAGFVVFLATWDIPAPSGRIERVIPNERFERK